MILFITIAFFQGVGGYLSSNAHSANKVGFSAYVRSRIKSVQPRFREDIIYIFFLLLVKEKIEIKRSKQVYMRQTHRNPGLTVGQINEVGLENLEKHNKSYSVYKNCRGTAMYFQKMKKDAMATLRQLGSPTLFFTLSFAEFQSDQLFHQVVETVLNRKISKKEFVEMNFATSERNKVIKDNVVQTTITFEKRLQKLLLILTNEGFPSNDSGSKYHVSDFFYRIEFQQRGSPHAHLMLYLQDENGESAPSLWTASNETMSEDTLGELHRKIEKINEDLISTSIDDAKCPAHSKDKTTATTCDQCDVLRGYVKKYQTHGCSFTCKKKGKHIHIVGSQGLGINEEDSFEIITTICRFKFPKYPLDETILLRPISKDEDPKCVNQMQKDLKHIRAYLIRRTQFKESKENEGKWLKFINFTFNEFLSDLGFFEGLSLSKSEDQRRHMAKQRYLNALRADINGSGYVYLKRKTCDIFINNYNRHLIGLLKCNHDLQYVFDQWCCANYITAYLTKNEAGMSKLMKILEEEFRGMPKFEFIVALGKILDKHREVSIQEAIYRLLGLPMSKFSTKVKFVNTNHPIKREGLLKGDLEQMEDSENLFHMSIHEYYEQRPFNNALGIDFVNMCLAEFVSDFEIRKTEVSNSIPLLDNNGFIVKRVKSAVLRYYLHYDEAEDLARGLLILFHPFRDENFDIHSHDVVSLLNDNKDLIEERRLKYEKNVNLIGLIKEIEKMNEEKSSDTNELEVNDEAAGELEEGETTNEQDIENFIKSMKATALKTIEKNTDKGVPTKRDLREKIILLNANQRLFFDDITERVFQMGGRSSDQFCVYLAGDAGVGQVNLL